MYTLHKLLKGRGEEEEGRVLDCWHRKEKWRHCKHPFSKHPCWCFGFFFFRVTVGGSGKNKQASVSACSQDVQLGTKLRQLLANKYITMKQIQSCEIHEPSTFQYADSKHDFSGFSYTLEYTGVAYYSDNTTLSERENKSTFHNHCPIKNYMHAVGWY